MKYFDYIFRELEKDKSAPYMNREIIRKLVCKDKKLLRLFDNETGNSLLHQAIINWTL